MKKTIFLLPLIFLSCYIWNYSGNSRIAIKLTSLPAGIKAIHVAVYSGNPDDHNLLSKEVLYSGSIGNIEVTAGTNRYFVFLGENTDGLGEYYGISGPYTIKEDETVDVVVSMGHINDPDLVRGPDPDYDKFLLDYECSISSPFHDYFIWNTLSGATSYNLSPIIGEDTNGDPIYGTVSYSGMLPFFYIDEGDPNCRDHAVDAFFSDFGIYTIKSEDYDCGC